MHRMAVYSKILSLTLVGMAWCIQKVQGSWTQKMISTHSGQWPAFGCRWVWGNVVYTTDLMLILMYGILMNVCCCFNSILNLSKWILQWIDSGVGCNGQQKRVRCFFSLLLLVELATKMNCYYFRILWQSVFFLSLLWLSVQSVVKRIGHSMTLYICGRISTPAKLTVVRDYQFSILCYFNRIYLVLITRIVRKDVHLILLFFVLIFYSSV